MRLDGGEVVGEYLLDEGEQQVLGVHEDGEQRFFFEGVEDGAGLRVAQRVVADCHVLQQHLVDAEADLVAGQVWREELGVDVLYYLFLFFEQQPLQLESDADEVRERAKLGQLCSTT